MPMAVPQQFLQRKVAPGVMFYGPEFTVMAKPAGWTAISPPCHRDIATDSEAGSGAGEDERLLCSGCVEPLQRHSAALHGSWRPVMAPGPSVSGWALVAHSRGAERYLARALRLGRLSSLSLALVEGALEPGLPAATAHRADGALEVSVLAGYQRSCAGGWGSEEVLMRYTLVLLRAAGSACGGERALLKLTTGHAVLGDAEHGGGGAEQWFGGRPFFHAYALLSTDTWWVHALGLAVLTCPLPADLRMGLHELRSSSHGMHETPAAASVIDAEHLRLALSISGLLPAEFAVSLGLPPQSALPSEAARALVHPGTGPVLATSAEPLKQPVPFGLERWGGPVSRQHWLVAFLLEAVRHAWEYGLSCGSQGEVLVRELLERFPGLKAACYGSHHQLAQTVERDVSKALVLGGPPHQLTLRCRPAQERLQVFVEAYASRLAPGSRLTVAELVENAHVKRLLSGRDLPYRPLLECLAPSPLFDVVPTADALTLRPVRERMRLGIERLMTELDPWLQKRMQKDHGSVPLAWLLANYSMLLIGPRSTPLLLSDAVSALEGSEVLEVDRGTFSVRRRNAMTWSQAVAPLQQPAMKPCSSRFSCKDVRVFRSLLDHYFEPFNLQHNRLILHSAEEERSADGKWRWLLTRLSRDLTRVGATLNSLTPEAQASFLQQAFSSSLKHVRAISLRLQTLLELKYDPDFRLPVLAPSSPRWLTQHFLAAAERLPSLPPTAAVVLSYAVGCHDSLDGPAGSGRHAGHPLARERQQRRILRQLLAYGADVLCLQQCEADLTAAVHSETLACAPARERAVKGGSLLCMLARHLEQEDFEWCAAPAKALAGGALHGHVNAIFWRRARWQMSAWRAGEGGALHVALRPQRGLTWQLSVGCVEASGAKCLQAQLETLEGHLQPPAVLCGAFGAGPAEVAEALRAEGLAGFRSAHPEVLGRELPWTTIVGRGDAGRRLDLRPWDGIWLRGGALLTPLAALAGHKHGPWMDARGLVCSQALPADHLPLVAALEYAPPGGSNACLTGCGPPQFIREHDDVPSP